MANQLFSKQVLCLGLAWFIACTEICAIEEIKVVEDRQYVRNKATFDSKIETERAVEIALARLSRILVSHRSKFFGADSRDSKSDTQVLTSSACEKLVVPALATLRSPEQLTSFAAVCRTKSSLYGRYEGDGVGLIYEAAYCKALENLARFPSARSELLMNELPLMFVYDGASGLFFDEQLEICRRLQKQRIKNATNKRAKKP